MIRKFYGGPASREGGATDEPKTINAVHVEKKEPEKRISVNELYDFIVSKMTPEEALKKLLSSTIVKYEKLKFEKPMDMIHPEILIAMAAFDLGWDVAVESEKGDKNAQVEGLVVGNAAYMERIFKSKNKENAVGPKSE